MTRRLIVALILIGVISTAWAAPQPINVVRRDGTALVDEAGQPLVLRGVNLGGWMLWEAWMWGAKLSIWRMGPQSQSHVLERMTSILGAAETARFEQATLESFVTEEDIASIAALGFNVVRVPLNHRHFAPGAPGFDVLDRLLRWCEKHRVYVVLDLHAAPGGQNDLFISDPQQPSLWDSAERRAQTASLWRAIAQRYATRAIIVGYDVLNEPAPPSGKALVDVYRQIIAAIREVDPHHLVILEGGKFARDFSMFVAPLDSQQVYSFHIYTWFGENPAKMLKPWTQLAQTQGVPLWCGEFGENTAAVIAKTLDVFDAQSPALAGWSFWTWKRTGGGNAPALNEIRPPDDWIRFMQWAVNKRGTAPSAAALRAASAGFLEAVQLRATVRNIALADTLSAHARSRRETALEVER